MILLECRNICCSLGGVMALGGVDLTVRQGEILGVIGPNGSGKTTLVNVVSGITPASAGTIAFRGASIAELPSWKRTRLGIARTFQMLRLFPEMSVVDNVMLPFHHRMRSGLLASVLGRASARQDDLETRKLALDLLHRFDLGGMAERPAGELSIGQQRMVELARGMIAEPQLFILDEPAAGLSPTNVERLIALLRNLRDQHGITIVLVEHVMKVVRSVCDRIVVLEEGRKIADGNPDEVTNDPRVVDAYLGSGRVRRRA